jgi:hypothetical protein
MMLRHEPHLRIAPGDEDPPVEMVAACECQEKLQRRPVRRSVPSEAPPDISRIGGNRMIIGHKPDRNAAPSQAASNRKTAMGAAEDERAKANRGASHSSPHATGRLLSCDVPRPPDAILFRRAGEKIAFHPKEAFALFSRALGQHRACDGACGVTRSGNEAHQRAEARDSRRADEVQPRHSGCKPTREVRRTLLGGDPLPELAGALLQAGRR